MDGILKGNMCSKGLEFLRKNISLQLGPNLDMDASFWIRSLEENLGGNIVSHNLGRNLAMGVALQFVAGREIWKLFCSERVGPLRKY